MCDGLKCKLGNMLHVQDVAEVRRSGGGYNSQRVCMSMYVCVHHTNLCLPIFVGAFLLP